MTWLVNPPSYQTFGTLTGAAADRAARRDVFELTPSCTAELALRRAAERRAAVDGFLFEITAKELLPRAEFLEVPSWLDRVYDTSRLSKPSLEEAAGQVARMRVQRDSVPLLLVERLVDAVIVWSRGFRGGPRRLYGTTIRLDAALDQSHTRMPGHRRKALRLTLADLDAKLEEMSYPNKASVTHEVSYLGDAEWARTTFPFRVVVETADAMLASFLRDPRLRDWVGIGVDLASRYGSPRPNSLCSEAQFDGQIGGYVDAWDEDSGRRVGSLVATCAHVVGRCPAVLLRGSSPYDLMEGPAVSGDPPAFHAPDAALIDPFCQCLVDQIQNTQRDLGSSNSTSRALTWPYTAAHAFRDRLVTHYLGNERSSSRGYVMGTTTFWSIGTAHFRCPVVEMLPLRSPASKVMAFLKGRRGFSGPGDSGAWIGQDSQPGVWLGMIAADRPSTGSSFAIEARFLAEFFAAGLGEKFNKKINIQVRG